MDIVGTELAPFLMQHFWRPWEGFLGHTDIVVGD